MSTGSRIRAAADPSATRRDHRLLPARPGAHIVLRIREDLALAPAIAGLSLDPTVPPGTPRSARLDDLDTDTRLSRLGQTCRADAQDQLRRGHLSAGLPRATRRWRPRRTPLGCRARLDPRWLQPAG